MDQPRFLIHRRGHLYRAGFAAVRTPPRSWRPTGPLKVDQAGGNTAKLNRAIAGAHPTAIREITDSVQNKAIRQARPWAGSAGAALLALRIDFNRLNRPPGTSNTRPRAWSWKLGAVKR